MFLLCLSFISGFLEKNRDALSSDLIQLVETSTNKLLKQAFRNELSSCTTKSSANPRMVITAANNTVRVSAVFSFSFRQSRNDS